MNDGRSIQSESRRVQKSAMGHQTATQCKEFLCFAILISSILAADCARYVTVETSNGINNQRESILNGLLVAKAIDATFVLPSVYPIWYKDAVGNSDGKAKWSSEKYRKPWTGMSFMFSLAASSSLLAVISLR